MNNLKRYKLGREAIAKAGNRALMCAGIVADKDGDYYKREEVDALLESIGAGEVSGRITQRPIEQPSVPTKLTDEQIHEILVESGPFVVWDGELSYIGFSPAPEHDMLVICRAIESAVLKNSKEKTLAEHRAEFELWAEGEGMRTYRHSFLDGSFYTLRDTEKEWLAWQAARGISE